MTTPTTKTLSASKPLPYQEGGVAKKKGRGQRGRDLSFYLNYVLSSLPPRDITDDVTDDVGDAGWSESTVVSLVTSLSEALDKRSSLYARTFQPLVPDESRPLKAEVKNGEKHYDINLLLKRPIYPNMFEVQTGQLYGLPPGCALYRIRKCTSREESQAMRRLWRGCLDRDGYVSPLKVYPWLAKAILDTVVYLRERNDDWRHLDFRLQASFPFIRMELTFRKDASHKSRNTRTSTRTSRSRVSSPRSEYNSSATPSGYRITSAKSEYVDDVFECTGDSCYDADDDESQCVQSTTHSASIMSGPVKEDQNNCDHNHSAVNSQTPSSSRITSASTSKNRFCYTRQSSTKSSQIGALSPLIARTSTAWAFLDENQVPDPPETIHLNFIPTIEGFGWPKGVQFPQLLPKQRPWSLLSKQWASDLRDSIKDGEPFWELNAFNPKDIPDVGSTNYVPYWHIHFQPTKDYLMSRLSELAISSTIESLFDVFDLMTEDAGKIWSFLGNRIKNEVKVTTIKNNLHRNGTVGEWFLAILAVTSKVLEKKLRLQGAATTEGIDEKFISSRFLAVLRNLHDISMEDPRRLVDMIKLPDGTVGPEANNGYLSKMKKSSTPASTHRSSLTPTTKSVVSEEPAKPPRMLYRLFSKNF